MEGDVRQEAEERRLGFGNIVIQLAEVRALQTTQGNEMVRMAAATAVRDKTMEKLSRQSRIAQKRLRVIYSAQKKTSSQCQEASETTNRRLMFLIIGGVLFGLGGIPEVRLFLIHLLEKLV